MKRVERVKKRRTVVFIIALIILIAVGVRILLFYSLKYIYAISF